MCKDQSDYHVIAGLLIGFFFLLEFSIISKFSTMILLHLHKENNKISNKKERALESGTDAHCPDPIRQFLLSFPTDGSVEWGTWCCRVLLTLDFSIQRDWKSCSWVEVLVSVLLAYELKCVSLGPSYLF